MTPPTTLTDGDETGTGRCAECGAAISTEPETITMGPGRPAIRIDPPTHCEACANANQERRQQRARQRAALDVWETWTPTTYRNSDPDRFAPWIREALGGWLRAKAPTTGIGLVGPTGRGKTRAAYLALRTLALRGHTIAAISHLRLADLAIDYYAGNKTERAEARHTRDRIDRADYLLLDDVGKAPTTDRSEAVLVDLIETRTANGRPIVWTSECRSRDLAAIMNATRAEAFLRRLAEFAPPAVEPDPEPDLFTPKP